MISEGLKALAISALMFVSWFGRYLFLGIAVLSLIASFGSGSTKRETKICLIAAACFALLSAGSFAVFNSPTLREDFITISDDYDKKVHPPLTNQEPTVAEEDQKPQAQNSAPIELPSKLIGANKDQVSDIMKNAGYSPTKSYYDYDMAFKKTGKVEVHIIFNDSGTAIGTAFFSLDGKSTGNGSESYVNKHYDELIKFSNGDDTTLPIKNNVNNKDRKYPSEVYVGDQRDND